MSTREWGVSVREGEREKNHTEKEEETHIIKGTSRALEIKIHHRETHTRRIMIKA